MGIQQRTEARTLYAASVADDDDTKRLLLENQRLRDRVAVLEGMMESLAVGIGGSLDAMLDWMKRSRLSPPEGD